MREPQPVGGDGHVVHRDADSGGLKTHFHRELLLTGQQSLALEVRTGALDPACMSHYDLRDVLGIESRGHNHLESAFNQHAEEDASSSFALSDAIRKSVRAL